MTLYNVGIRCARNLQQKDISSWSISAVTEGEMEVTTFYERRMECRLAEFIVNGKIAYFRPAESICLIAEISVAGSKDVVRNGKDPVQAINASTSTIKR